MDAPFKIGDIVRFKPPGFQNTGRVGVVTKLYRHARTGEWMMNATNIDGGWFCTRFALVSRTETLTKEQAIIAKIKELEQRFKDRQHA